MAEILITGGAGFIGTHLCAALAGEHAITVLDTLSEQIHGPHPEPAIRALPNVTLLTGDVCDRETLQQALAGREIVIHLAAETGTGQSMYETGRYQRTNVDGMLMLASCLSQQRSVRKLVLASSRAVYGEGKYNCATHGIVFPGARNPTDMARGLFEPRCPTCGNEVVACPTDEMSARHPLSFYGLTKRVQEDIATYIHDAFHIPTAILRYQNVFGPGQQLNNPYTGVLSVFSTQLRNNETINVFEDGRESRDFVFIDDVVAATVQTLKVPTPYFIANIGTGTAHSILEAAEALKQLYGSASSIAVSGNFRIGDIRHNRADLARATDILGYQSRVSFGEGLARYAAWAQQQPRERSRLQSSLEELRRNRLLQ